MRPGRFKRSSNAESRVIVFRIRRQRLSTVLFIVAQQMRMRSVKGFERNVFLRSNFSFMRFSILTGCEVTRFIFHIIQYPLGQFVG